MNDSQPFMLTSHSGRVHRICNPVGRPHRQFESGRQLWCSEQMRLTYSTHPSFGLTLRSASKATRGSGYPVGSKSQNNSGVYDCVRGGLISRLLTNADDWQSASAAANA